jgi:hypothetical protein
VLFFFIFIIIRRESPTHFVKYFDPEYKWAFLSPGGFFKISNQDLEHPERLASLRYQPRGNTIPLQTMFRNQSKSAGRQERPFVVNMTMENNCGDQSQYNVMTHARWSPFTFFVLIQKRKHHAVRGNTTPTTTTTR